MQQLSLPAFDRLFVVLVCARNPLNIGSAARAMSNFGFVNLRVVNPYSLPFREAKSAVDASFVLKRAVEFEDLSDAIADCSLVVGTTAARNRKLDHELHPLRQGAHLVRKHLQSGKVALLFGSEKRGLSKRDFSYCHCLMRIPTQDTNPSMNLGQAVAVCLYEIARDQGRLAKRDAQSVLASAELDRLESILLEALHTSGYVKRSSTAAAEQNVRRLLRRLKLSQEDSRLLQGMLRQMLWKMRH